MAVDEPDTIDAIGVDRETDRVVLTISDHLPWLAAADEHRELLRDKLNTYLAFVESGELLETYPDAVGKDILIRVVGKFGLSLIGTEFFASATQVVKTAGISLEFKKGHFNASDLRVIGKVIGESLTNAEFFARV